MTDRIVADARPGGGGAGSSPGGGSGSSPGGGAGTGPSPTHPPSNPPPNPPTKAGTGGPWPSGPAPTGPSGPTGPGRALAFDKGRRRPGDHWGPGGRYNPDNSGCGKKAAEMVIAVGVVLLTAGIVSLQSGSPARSTAALFALALLFAGGMYGRTVLVAAGRSQPVPVPPGPQGPTMPPRPCNTP